MRNSPSSEIVHIYTPHEIQEVYGKEAFAHFLEENQFEIQSTKTQSNGKEVRYSYKQLAKIWGPILSGLSSDKGINLGQAIRNFNNKNATPSQKAYIVQHLYQYTLSQYYHGEEVAHEVIMLGLAMMFQDDLDWDNAESIVHITGNAIDTIMSDVKAE